MKNSNINKKIIFCKQLSENIDCYLDEKLHRLLLRQNLVILSRLPNTLKNAKGI